MTIETDHAFSHKPVPRRKPADDLLGPLRGFVGSQTKRTWSGTGFNLIWRPNFGGVSGPNDYFLELNLTKETLDFTDITGTGIANRGLLQPDIALGGLAYLQQIRDQSGNSQHFEPGVWLNVPATANPKEEATVVRLGSIPHGTTINLQGKSLEVAGPPHFKAASITPFKIGSPDDGETGLAHFPEEDLKTPGSSRTPPEEIPGLTQAQLSNPNLFLSEAIAHQKIVRTTVLTVTSDTSAANSVPNRGGGIRNIAFLTGNGAPPAGGPNADVVRVTATFWIEEIEDHGKKFDQLQYTQRVLLNFNGLSRPHVTVATLRAL